MSTESNKFAKIFSNLSKVSPTTRESRPTVAQPSKKTTQRMSRPRGKKNDPAFSQVTIYISKVNHQEAKKRLISEHCEFSELVEELLAKWLRTSGSPKVHKPTR